MPPRRPMFEARFLPQFYEGPIFIFLRPKRDPLCVRCLLWQMQIGKIIKWLALISTETDFI